MHCLKYTTTNKLLALKVENGNLFSVICIIKNDNINSFLYYYARNKTFVRIPCFMQRILRNFIITPFAENSCKLPIFMISSV